MGNRLGDLVREAQRLSAETMRGLGLDTDPIIAPPTRYLPGRAIARLEDDAPVLITDRALPEAEGVVLTRKNGVQVGLIDAAASSGGPGPNQRTDPLALRQRILAEAAVRSLSGDTSEPLVVSTPANWNPGEDWRQTDFFGGLDVPWLEQVDLRTVFATSTSPRDTTLPLYPRRERRAQIPFANQLATQELVTAGRTYAELLTFNDGVRDQLAKSAMLASSYDARDRPVRALTRARSTSIAVRLTMTQVVVEGPPFVMLSSDTGPIDLKVVNNLDETVTVRLEAVTGTEALTVDSPGEITLGPDQRAPVRITAQGTGIGVHSVTVRATTEEGTPLGTQVRFNVRTSNVGLVIWLVMGAGGGVFLLAIAARVRRRVRTRKATHGPLLEHTP